MVGVSLERLEGPVVAVGGVLLVDRVPDLGEVLPGQLPDGQADVRRHRRP